jgi:hypothetical protein
MFAMNARASFFVVRGGNGVDVGMCDGVDELTTIKGDSVATGRGVLVGVDITGSVGCIVLGKGVALVGESVPTGVGILVHPVRHVTSKTPMKRSKRFENWLANLFISQSPIGSE